MLFFWVVQVHAHPKIDAHHKADDVILKMQGFLPRQEACLPKTETFILYQLFISIALFSWYLVILQYR